MAIKTDDTKELEHRDKITEELAELRAEVERLRFMASNPKLIPDSGMKVKRDDKNPGGGWLVTTPIPTYAGVTEGISFAEGVAFVDVELPGVDGIIHRLEYDHGYTVQALTEDELNAQRKRQALRSSGPGTKTMLEKMTLKGVRQ